VAAGLKALKATTDKTDPAAVRAALAQVVPEMHPPDKDSEAPLRTDRLSTSVIAPGKTIH
jgi:hypothetical protein